MQIRIPRSSGLELNMELRDGEQLFVVGANGSGKSALLQHFVSLNSGSSKIRRISAHRQTWLESGSINITPEQRKDIAQSLVHAEAHTSARWVDHNAMQKQSAVLFDLVSKDNANAREIARYVREGSTERARKYAEKHDSLFDELNKLLEFGNLTVSIENSSGEEILARHRDQQGNFSIAQMSDGERNAVMIAATVLTVDAGTVLLIDEPERHLHRSIIQPFLSALFEQRPDCTFIISTHEISLVTANPEARSIMVRSCAWSGDTAQSWDVQILEKDTPLPEEFKKDILGARQQILFVEGEDSSLDAALYCVLFPDITVIPKGSCRDVQRAVAGVRITHNHHHVMAFGLIDKDDRLDSEIQELKKKSIFVLDMYSVEALYFCRAAVEAIANQQAKLLGCDATELMRSVEMEVLPCLRQDGCAKEMAARRCERQVRNLVLSRLPVWRGLMDGRTDSLPVEGIDNLYAEELGHFKALVDDEKLYDLVARYPVHKSTVLDKIARVLGCSDRHQYQRRVCILARNETDFSQELKRHLSNLVEALGD